MQELQLMKVRQAAGTVCLVLPLNSSDSALPTEVLNATAPVSNISYFLVQRAASLNTATARDCFSIVSFSSIYIFRKNKCLLLSIVGFAPC